MDCSLCGKNVWRIFVCTQSYPKGVRPDAWNNVGHCQVISGVKCRYVDIKFSSQYPVNI
ncbi:MULTISPECIES: hypothetical protein [Colwellia]|uniref:hypothetical protein n=1 Tax=Colwellia TaxID=28228 RepID=UPI000A65D511|nr:MULTISPECIES: hypothetical protein [Colwellia]